MGFKTLSLDAKATENEIIRNFIELIFNIGILF